MTRERELWLRFLYTFSMADHMGDASEAVRRYATKAGLPLPGDDADLEQWAGWVEQQGVDDGIYGD